MKKRIHFIGIGGVSMSGLAEILHEQGYIVSGSDRSESNITSHLEELGICVFIGHKKENITADIDTVVYNAAIKADNPERVVAKEKSIHLIDRAELLGQIMKNYQYPISIAGTHGKTSTTSMISEIFLNADKDPTISVGGFLPSIGGNFKMGHSEYFIVESCEYWDSFLQFYPHIAVILNIELDHVDYFKDYKQLLLSFRKFSENIGENGTVIICGEIKNLDYITENLKCNILTYGYEGCDCYAKNISFHTNGCPSYDLYFHGKFVQRITLSVFGEHNVLNSLASFCVACLSDISIQQIADGLKSYSGVDRRFQLKGSFNEVTVVDDYAHHPTEIKVTLKAARSRECHEIWCVFQPHTYSRTEGFFEEFAKSFDDCDYLILVDIYAARETNNKNIHAKDLANKIAKSGKKVFYFDSFAKTEKFLIDNCVPNDLLITMGAGDVYLIGEHIVTKNL